MYYILIVIAVLASIRSVDALQISEIFSNPVGDDSGREWVEIYNDEQTPLLLSKVGVSIKGAKPVTITPVSSQESIAPGEYAVVGSTLSGATLFTQDYPSFQGILGKAQMSLVNTGSATVALYYDGALMTTLDAYSPAKEGKSLARVSDVYSEQNPTPGLSNQSQVSEASGETSTQVSSPVSSSSGQNSIQLTRKQVEDVPEFLLKLPKEKMVIAGADTEYVLKASLSKGALTRPVITHWSFGDGGEKDGSTTTYAYAYTGTYNVVVDAWSGEFEGKTSMKVKVVSPNIIIGSIARDERGSYIELVNPNVYDLMISQWKISIDGVTYTLPRNTTLYASSTTKISGKALGFDSIVFSSTTKVLLLYPHNEIVTSYKGRNSNTRDEVPQVSGSVYNVSTATRTPIISKGVLRGVHASKNDRIPLKVSTPTTSPRIVTVSSHEGGVISWIKGFFKKG
jgi:hypothetical protein